MLALFLVCFILLLSCFCCVCCFAFTDYENTVFPPILVYSSHVAYKVVVYLVCFRFWFLFFLVLFCFHCRHMICIVLWLCCLVFLFFKTGLSGFVVCILWYYFLCVVLFWILLFCFFIPLKKRSPQNRTQQKPKNQKCRKKDKQKNQLAQLCSQIVFLILGRWATKMLCFAKKTYKNRGLSIFWERKKGPKMWKRLSWKSVQGWVEKLSNYAAQHNWTDFQLNQMCFPFFMFYKKSHSPCRKKNVFEL